MQNEATMKKGNFLKKVDRYHMSACSWCYFSSFHLKVYMYSNVILFFLALSKSVEQHTSRLLKQRKQRRMMKQ